MSRFKTPGQELTTLPVIRLGLWRTPNRHHF
jgi:hypothetical protein